MAKNKGKPVQTSAMPANMTNPTPASTVQPLDSTSAAALNVGDADRQRAADEATRLDNVQGRNAHPNPNVIEDGRDPASLNPADAGAPGSQGTTMPGDAAGLGSQQANANVDGRVAPVNQQDQLLQDLANTPEGKRALEEAAQKANAEAAEAARKQGEQQFANAKVPPLTPATAYQGEATKTMVSPREFFVLLDGGRRVQFKKGPQEVCESLSTHPYVVAHGVTAYDKK